MEKAGTARPNDNRISEQRGFGIVHDSARYVRHMQGLFAYCGMEAEMAEGPLDDGCLLVGVVCLV